jgi:DNA-binding NarL/FixJ family response regulator
MNSQLLVDVLTREEQFQVIEAEPTAAAILASAAKEKPDVILLSPILEDNATLGFQVARKLRTAHPNTRIVMLLDTSERISILEAFRAGARGVFCRTESVKSLARCIYSAHLGQVWANSRELGYVLEAVSQALPGRTADADGLSKLSKREQDVVRCVADGLSNREIAHRLNLTEHTVKNYLFRIFDKLGVSSRVEVVLYVFSSAQSAIFSHPRIPKEEEHTTSAKQSRNTEKLSSGRSSRRSVSPRRLA